MVVSLVRVRGRCGEQRRVAADVCFEDLACIVGGGHGADVGRAQQ